MSRDIYLYRFYTFITLLSSHFLVLNCSINQQSWSRWTPGELISEQDGMQTRHKAIGYCGASIWNPQSHRAVEFDSRTFLESLPFRATILLTHHHVTMCFENLWWPLCLFLHLCCHSHARDQRRLWTPVASCSFCWNHYIPTTACSHSAFKTMIFLFELASFWHVATPWVKKQETHWLIVLHLELLNPVGTGKSFASLHAQKTTMPRGPWRPRSRWSRLPGRNLQIRQGIGNRLCRWRRVSPIFGPTVETLQLKKKGYTPQRTTQILIRSTKTVLLFVCRCMSVQSQCRNWHRRRLSKKARDSHLRIAYCRGLSHALVIFA